MKMLNYWDQFLSTGKIDDYLAYREEKANTPKAAEPEKDEGAGSAGTGQCYRNDFKNGARWGM